MYLMNIITTTQHTQWCAALLFCVSCAKGATETTSQVAATATASTIECQNMHEVCITSTWSARYVGFVQAGPLRGESSRKAKAEETAADTRRQWHVHETHSVSTGGAHSVSLVRLVARDAGGNSGGGGSKQATVAMAAHARRQWRVHETHRMSTGGAHSMSLVHFWGTGRWRKQWQWQVEAGDGGERETAMAHA
jgi:hypothetical protein